VQGAVSEIRPSHSRLDLLIINGGVSEASRHCTAGGMELTIATNHLGPFALTRLLLDRPPAAAGSRVVTVSSIAHRHAVIALNDLQSNQGYRESEAFSQSELANLLFTYELNRRLEMAGAGTLAGLPTPVMRARTFGGGAPVDCGSVDQSASRSNQLLVYSKCSDGSPFHASGRCGPTCTRRQLLRPERPVREDGIPVRVTSTQSSHDATPQRRLWEVSEKLTGLSYGLPGSPSELLVRENT
jgi:hypothetical protein